MTVVTFPIAAGGDDGEVQRLGIGSAWPPTGGFTPNSSAAQIGVTLTDNANPYVVTVGLLRWDTSSIPVNAVISSAVLRAFINSAQSDDDRNLVAEWYEAGTVDSSDWSLDSTENAHSGTLIPLDWTNEFVEFALINLGNISRADYTGLRLHIDGGQPSLGAQNLVNVRSFEGVGGNEPELVVTYTVPKGRYYHRLVGPVQLGTSAADLLTVPDGATIELRNVYVNNPTAGTVKVTVSIGTDAVGTRVIESLDVPAGESRQGRRATHHTLAAGEKLQGFCDTASAAVITIDGYVRQA